MGHRSIKTSFLYVETRRTFKDHHHFFESYHNFSNTYDCSP